MFTNHSVAAEQDWPALAAYLQKQGFSFGDPGAIKRFSGGAANYNYLIKLDGKPAVMRCPPKGSAPGANDVAREYKVLKGLNGHFSYAPQALHLCEDSTVIGVPFCISEFRTGEPVTTQLPSRLQGQSDIGKVLGHLALDVLAKLHAVDPVASGLNDLGKAEGFLERQVGGWAKRAERCVKGEDLEKARQIISWLQSSYPEQRPVSILHNDFKLDNMLIDLETLQVNAVLDWDMCTIGDPLYDLVLVLLYWGQKGDSDLYHQMARLPYTADGWLSRRQALDYYLSRSAFSLTDSDLQFYWVLALYRFAVVIAQLVALYEAGAMQSEHVNDQNIDEVRLRQSALLDEALRQTEKLAF